MRSRLYKLNCMNIISIVAFLFSCFDLVYTLWLPLNRNMVQRYSTEASIEATFKAFMMHLDPIHMFNLDRILTFGLNLQNIYDELCFNWSKSFYAFVLISIRLFKPSLREIISGDFCKTWFISTTPILRLSAA